MFTSLSGMEGQRGDSSLDLSHLTVEEQSYIQQVLQRDLELRTRDEGRVRSVRGARSFSQKSHFCPFGHKNTQTVDK